MGDIKARKNVWKINSAYIFIHWKQLMLKNKMIFLRPHLHWYVHKTDTFYADVDWDWHHLIKINDVRQSFSKFSIFIHPQQNDHDTYLKCSTLGSIFEGLHFYSVFHCYRMDMRPTPIEHNAFLNKNGTDHKRRTLEWMYLLQAKLSSQTPPRDYIHE